MYVVVILSKWSKSISFTDGKLYDKVRSFNDVHVFL